METERHFSSLSNSLPLSLLTDFHKNHIQLLPQLFTFIVHSLLIHFPIFSLLFSFHFSFPHLSLPSYFLPHPFFTSLIFTETRLSQTDIFNEACTLRLAAYYGTNRGRGRRQLDHLMKRTDFSKNELKLLYWGWKCICPSGLLTESNFKEMYAQFFPQAGQYDDILIFIHYDISLILPLH